MVNRGIGRPSTYASIITNIQNRDYVNKLKERLLPSFVAVAVTQLLENHFKPLVDIDFICWGPFADTITMCDSLTAAYVEDCSYSPNPTETCDIINAVTGQFYVLLITNYSNQICNIDFSQTGGNGTTDCCILGDAGDDNITPGYTACSSDPSFNMEDELNGLPSTNSAFTTSLK